MIEESELYRKGVENYIRQGTSYTPVRQLHFMDIVPEPDLEVRGNYKRTINDFFGVDFVPTVTTIRGLYVPRFEPWEAEMMEGTLAFSIDWINDEENKKLFGETYQESDYKRLPFEVLLNLHTLHFSKGVFKYVPDNIPVAFNPDDSYFRPDIQRITWRQVDRFKLFPYEMGKQLNPNTFSTSGTLRVLTELFWGVDEGRYDAIDVLTWELLKVYFLELKRRSENLTFSSNPDLST